MATTETLLTSIKQRAFAPTAQETFTDANLLALATEELQLGIAPLLLSSREDYYTAYKDTAGDGTTTSFTIPTRAIGAKVKQVVLVNSAGTEYRVNRVNPVESDYFGYHLRYNKVVFTEAPSATTTVRIYYHLRPNDLVAVTDTARITSIASNTVEVATLPATITVGTVVDLVKGTPGYETIALDTTPTVIVGTSVTFASLPTGLAVGDYIALAGQSPVVQAPHELIPLLAQRTAVKVLEALGDVELMQLSQSKLGEMERTALRLLDPRVDVGTEKIVNHNSSLRRCYPRRNYF